MLCEKDARNLMQVLGFELNLHQISWIIFFKILHYIILSTYSSILKYPKKIKENELN